MIQTGDSGVQNRVTGVSVVQPVGKVGYEGA